MAGGSQCCVVNSRVRRRGRRFPFAGGGQARAGVFGTRVVAAPGIGTVAARAIRVTS
jgi:hypothetical protein